MPLRLIALVCLLIAVLTPIAWGQEGGSQPPVDQRLEPRVLNAESIGLSLHPPKGTEVSIEAVRGVVTLLMSDNPPQPQWRLRAQLLAVEPGIQTAADEALQRLRSLNATREPITLLTNEPVTFGGVDGNLLLVERRPPVTDPDQRTILNGWLTLRSDSETFILITIVSLVEYWPEAEQELRAAFQTIRVTPATALRDERAARLTRGVGILRKWTEKDFERVLHEPRLYRIYRPSASGDVREDVEVGYLQVRCVEAMRGEIEPSRSPIVFRSEERTSGIMVEIEARALVDNKSNHTRDVFSRLWISWDRTQEAWNARTTETMGRIARGFAQTGVRQEPGPGQPRPTLTVINSSETARVNDDTAIIKPIPHDAYLSQAELHLLGRLLPKDGSITELFSTYYYDSARDVITQRVDRWEKAADGSGNWVLTTQPAIDSPEVIQIFSPEGDLVKRIDGDGTVREPISPADLEKLWRSKGLVKK